MYGIHIDFAIIGFQKCGTTSIHNYLGMVPTIFMPREKEMYYFSSDKAKIKNEAYFRAFFAGSHAKQTVGFSDVDLVCRAQALRELQATYPEIKLIVCVRNPAKRAFSAWNFERHKFREPEECFRTALEKDAVANRFGYIERGLYHRHACALKSIVAMKNVIFVRQEAMQANIAREMQRILNFLAIDCAFEEGWLRKYNEAGAPRFQTLQKMMWNQDNLAHKVGGMLPMAVKRFIKAHVKKAVISLNTRTGIKKVMTEADYDCAKSFFADDYAKFCAEFLNGEPCDL